MCRTLNVIILSCSVAAASCAADDLSKATSVETIVADLGSANFRTRVEASQRLADLPIEDLRAAAERSDEHLSAEVAVRLLKELELRYVKASGDELFGVSDILETMNVSERLLLADGARRILDDHWRIRVELARLDLEKQGAVFRKGTFSSRRDLGWLPGANLPSVQILIGEKWKGKAEGLRIISRMSRLTDPAMRSAGVFVWLLEGHPLTDEEYSVLSDLVGQDRIQERSRVALGIKWMQGSSGGVLIDGVTKGSSAADAKLQRMDRILAIVEPIPEDLPSDERQKLEEKQNLRDFDDLVERLKKYRDGDVIKLRVVRAAGFLRPNSFGRPPEIPPQIELPVEIVPVKLKGWEKLPVEPR